MSECRKGRANNELTNHNTQVPVGAKVRWLGLSGFGKTTLLKLLSRLYQPPYTYYPPST